MMYTKFQAHPLYFWYINSRLRYESESMIGVFVQSLDARHKKNLVRLLREDPSQEAPNTETQTTSASVGNEFWLTKVLGHRWLKLLLCQCFRKSLCNLSVCRI